MLRSTRSMPTLRVLNSTIKNEIQSQSKNFQQISTRYNLVTPNIPYNEETLSHGGSTIFKRFVHQTNKKNQTTLLSNKTEFNLMSLNSLKLECRKRGLKISGRKAELVSRISNFEQSGIIIPNESKTITTKTFPKVTQRTQGNKPQPPNITNNQLSKTPKDINKVKNFSITKSNQAKGDDSHIDYIKPIDIEPTKLVGDDYIVQVPSITSKASKIPITKVEKVLSETKAASPVLNSTVVSKSDGSDSKIFEQGSPEGIDQQNKEALNTKPIGEEDGTNTDKEEFFKYDDSKISNNDKTFFASFLTLSGIWWFFKKDGKKNKKESK